MGLQYRELDQRTRHFIKAEIEMDMREGRLYITHRLTAAGAQAWPALLIEAAEQYDDDWLAGQLRGRRLLSAQEERRTKRGVVLAAVPVTAHVTLAEGEFTRFYVRGICLRAVEQNTPRVVVYRARHSEYPRPESERLIGQHVSASDLLRDLRESVGEAPSIGIALPNSGLCVHLP
jgi:hypothetical protein